MGCNCNRGGRNTANIIADSTAISNGDMKQYIESLGWIYAGMCGCTNNMMVFYNQNPKYQFQWEIWMNVQQTQLQFRRRFGTRDTRIVGGANKVNFAEMYNKYLP